MEPGALNCVRLAREFMVPEERERDRMLTSKGRSGEGTRELSSCEHKEADADLSCRRTLKLMFRVTGHPLTG